MRFDNPVSRTCQWCGARIAAGLFCSTPHFQAWQKREGVAAATLTAAYKQLEYEVLGDGDRPEELEPAESD